MNIIDNSIIGTVMDYANVKFGVDLSKEQASEQIRGLSFSNMLALVNAIKDEDDDKFSELIDLSSVTEAYGTVGTQAPSAATIRSSNVRQAQADRRDTNLSVKAAVRSNPGSSTVAGAANKVATGASAAPTQADANADAAQDNSQEIDQNQQEIDRLRQLINKTSGRTQ